MACIHSGDSDYPAPVRVPKDLRPVYEQLRALGYKPGQILAEGIRSLSASHRLIAAKHNDKNEVKYALF